MVKPLSACTLCLLLITATAAHAQSYSGASWQPQRPALVLSGLPGGDFEASGALRTASYESGYDPGYSPWTPGVFPEQDPYDPWCWQLLPDGILYPAYLGGRLESRLSTVILAERDNWYWDSTLGGRVGILRFGNTATTRPQGWQLDLEGATFVRLNPEQSRDLEDADFRFGIPLTYAYGAWQYKFAYYHLSSHLPDEYIARNPGATGNNYSRDALVLGAAFYPHPDWRLYAETGFAFSNGGPSQPWEFQFGADYSPVDARDRFGSPFMAFNGHLRQEVDFGGNFVAQAGWQWRGTFNDHLFRVGLQYFNGQSTFFQFYQYHEEQLGLGMWYDY